MGEREIDRLLLRRYAAAVAGNRAFPAFDAGSGWLFTSIGLIWSVDLSRDWVVVGNLESRHLRGDAARRPLTERTSNYYATAGLAYRF